MKKETIGLKTNVEYVLRDSKGKVKKLWKDNLVGQAIREALRKIAPSSRFAVQSIRVPFLTGRYTSALALHNLVVNAGLAGVASRINGAGGEAAFTYIAIGTGTTAPAPTDTALQSEITTGGGARAAATTSRVTTDTPNDTAQNVVTFTFTSSFAVTESGVFNAAGPPPAGTMLARQTFAAINVANGDSLQVTWKFDVD
jgi:hypothetical protein